MTGIRVDDLASAHRSGLAKICNVTNGWQVGDATASAIGHNGLTLARQDSNLEPPA